MIHSFYDLKKDSIDVLFLGSSHCYYGVQPNLLWNEYGITSYVLGSPSQTMSCSYFLLEEALKYQHPQVVALEGYYLRSDSHYLEEVKLRAITDGMRPGKARRELFQTVLSDKSFEEKLSWYFPFFKYHSRWQELKYYDFHQESFHKGSRVLTKVNPCSKPDTEGIEPVQLADICTEYLDRIIDLCNEKGIALVVFYAPINDEDGKKRDWFETSIGQALTGRDFLDDRNVPFLYLQDDPKLNINYETDFYNFGHLNISGCTKLTRYLGEYMISSQNVSTHTDEKGYGDWDRDYEKYINSLNDENVAVLDDV